ncbi:putative serine protease HtrA [Rhodococcoides trifolii]|uniref:Serine protease HtrA n=1 Tax=Rhodococcoides trifolii TaxID=908250 RepID=A0A917FZ01_9NOCA|nr:trypsin-like peptidase domain-containing protein [Rhodococcus trifolii]GGG14741.1 putative serine protease HtrA [Rhodococcus trifolii]
MSSDDFDGSSGTSSVREDPPRLPPRPVYRPSVDAHSARAFARPRGVDGSFAGPSARRSPSGSIAVAPPDPVLEQAFGRPEGVHESLVREPNSDSVATVEQAPEDPWRDPNSPVTLGRPGAPEEAEPERTPGRKLGVREVLFGNRVSPRALAALGVVALVIALVGGLVGSLTAGLGGSLTSSRVSLTQDTGEAPQGQVARVAEAVLPAVVSIQVTFGDGAGTGSGVVIDPAGYIVTNNHVISMAATNPSATLSVTFSDGTKVPGSIVGRDTKTDLAVIKTDVAGLTVAQLGTSSDVQVGDEVVAIGSPLGLSKTVTSGIVSAQNRPVSLSGEGTDTDAVIDAVQTDAAINPGNSGGPLVDFEGRVIGINSAIRSESGGSVGLGFAIPIDTVTRVAQTLIRDGEMHHATIGINARTVVNDALSGAQVANVVAGSPAAQSGIVEGDVVVKVGDRTVASSDELIVAVQERAIGETVPIQLVRSGRVVDVSVTTISD